MRPFQAILCLLLALPSAAAAAQEAAPPLGAPEACLPAPAAASASLPARITACLTEAGFENVSVGLLREKVYISVENRRFRYDTRGLNTAVELIRPMLHGYDSFTLVVKRMGLVVWQTEASTDAPGPELAAAITPRQGDPALRDVTWRPESNPSIGKVEIVVTPQVGAALGSFEDPVRSYVTLAPELRVYAWRGMMARAQVLAPLQSDFVEDKKLMPGFLTLSQAARLPLTSYGLLTVGYFALNRWGYDARVRKYGMGGRVAAEARLGRTGYLRYSGGRWLYSGLDTPIYFLSGQAVVSERLQLVSQVGYGRYLHGDRGMQVQLKRTFKEVEIAFFGLRSGGETDAGVNILVPLPGARYMRPRRFRVRPAEAMELGYQYNGRALQGQIYEVGFDQDTFWRGLEPGLARSRWQTYQALRSAH